MQNIAKYLNGDTCVSNTPNEKQILRFSPIQLMFILSIYVVLFTIYVCRYFIMNPLSDMLLQR